MEHWNFQNLGSHKFHKKKKIPKANVVKKKASTVNQKT